jgi:hypothetical protein
MLQISSDSYNVVGLYGNPANNTDTAIIFV